MAYTSGSDRVTIRSYLDLVLSWSRTGTSGNSSTINVKLDLVATSGSYTINAPGSPADAQIIVNGTTYETNNINLTSTTGKNLMNINVTLPHNNDGSQTLRLYASLYSPNGVYLGGTYWSYSTIGTVYYELPKLSTGSSFTLNATQYYIGSAIPVKITRGANNHKLYFYALLNGTVIDTWTYEAGNTLPTSLGASTRQLTEAPKILRNSDRGVITLSMETYVNEAVIGRQSLTITGILPTTYKPKVTAISIAAVNPSTVPSTHQAKYIKTISQVKCTITASAYDTNAPLGDTSTQPSWYEVNVDGTTYYGKQITSSLLEKASIPIKARVRDSRGRWSDWFSRSNLTVLNYTSPTIEQATAQRYSSGSKASTGVTSPSGTYLGVYAVIKGMGPMTVKVTSTDSTSNVTSTKSSTTSATSPYTIDFLSSGLSITSEHLIEIKVTDMYGGTLGWQKEVASGSFSFIIGKDNIGVNKLPTKKGIEAVGDLYLDSGEIYIDDLKLIELGSNTNGVFAKFSNGLLICWKSDLALGAPTNQMNQVYASSSVTWTFPHAFITIPSVSGMPVSGRAGAWLALGDGAVKTNNTSFRLYYPYNNATTSTASVFAIGKWV